VDVRQLRYFLAIVDHDGFSRAAEALHVSQPALSQTIATLERELHVQLFHRIGRRATLSAAGEELLGHARVVLRDLDTAHAAMDAVRGVRSGRVDISSMPSPGIEPLASIIAAYTRQHPEISLCVDGAFTADEVLAAVRTGAAEVGLLGTATELHAPGVSVQPLVDQSLVLVTRQDDPRFGSVSTITRDELAGARFIASPTGSRMRSLLDDALAAGVELDIAVQVAHRTSILPLVLRGVGVAILPSSWVPLATASGLHTVAIQPSSLLRVALVSRRDHLSAAAAAFLEVAREVAAGFADAP